MKTPNKNQMNRLPLGAPAERIPPEKQKAPPIMKPMEIGEGLLPIRMCRQKLSIRVRASVKAPVRSEIKRGGEQGIIFLTIHLSQQWIDLVSESEPVLYTEYGCSQPNSYSQKTTWR